MPARLLAVALGWTLITSAVIVVAVASEANEASRQAHASAAAHKLALTSRYAARAAELSLALGDPQLAAEVGQMFLDDDPDVVGVSIEPANGTATSLGSIDPSLPHRSTPVHGPTVEADLLFWGATAPGDKAPAHDLGTVTVYLEATAAKPPVLGWASVRLGAVLSLVLLGYLALTLWIRHRVRRLASVAAALAAGQLDDEARISGRDEVAWASRSLADLRVVLNQQVASVRDRNADLVRSVTLTSDRLERAAAFASELVAPLAETSVLAEATRSLAAKAEAPVAVLLVPNPVGGELMCEASVGLSAQLDDPRLVRGAEGLELPTAESPVTTYAAFGTEHPWMEAAGRKVPCGGVAAVALHLRGRLEGVVFLARTREFSDADHGFLKDIGGPFSIALANRRAYEAVVAMKRALQTKNDALLAQREQLEVVDRMRAQFVANMSHELRTPLNAIIGYTELIADGCFGITTKEQAEPLQNVLDASASLLNLVNQVLDLSHAESGEAALDFEWCEVLDVAQEVARLNLPACKGKPVTVVARGNAAAIETDPQRLRQILHNLVGNAVKFTEEGSVELIVSGSANGGVDIVVDDSGIGIPASHLELIFDEFRQVDGSATRSYDGVGLGLAISRRFANAIGGTLEVSSVQGEGSRFTLHLPMRAPSIRDELAKAS